MFCDHILSIKVVCEWCLRQQISDFDIWAFAKSSRNHLEYCCRSARVPSVFKKISSSSTCVGSESYTFRISSTRVTGALNTL